MSKEELYLRALQIAFAVNTLLLVVGVGFAISRRINLHRQLNGFVVSTTIIAVIGLVITLLLGWDYTSVVTAGRMRVHRAFSIPLLIALVLTVAFGVRGSRRVHRAFAVLTVPCWVGTLVTGLFLF